MQDSVVAAETRPLALRMRPDLRCEKNFYQGHPSWIIKDPVGLKYYRLAEEEFTALKMLDGTASLEQIKAELERRFPPWIVEYSELQSLLGMFHRSGLVLSNYDGQGEQLFRRHKTQRRRQLLGRLSSILWIRTPGVDPETFLSWLHPKCRWFFTRAGLLTCCLLAVAALLLVLVQWNQFQAKLPAFYQFFGPGNIAWMMVALLVSKVLHELGHGLACKHFGGECHEIGLMFLVFTPCMYCDTSDSWMLGNRWHRAAIGAAGMYVEVFLAAICTFVWWFSEPGVVHYVALSTMFVCSVSTVLFNSNPLLRFDGYYILSDVLEIPNLSQKSRAAMIGVLRHWCLGLPWDERTSLPPRRRVAFAVYSVASLVYRWMVLIFILWFLSKVFEPYGLQPIGHVLIGMSLFGVVVMPAWQVFQYFRVPGRTRQVKKLNLVATAVGVAVVLGGVIMIPVPHRVMAPLVIQPRDAEHIYVEVPGLLSQVAVQPGQQVRSRQRLAELANLEMSVDLTRLRGESQRVARQLENLREREGEPSVAAQIPKIEQRLASLQEQVKQREEDRQRLTLICNTAGTVMPARDRPAAKGPQGALDQWSGSPLDEVNTHCWLESGTVFCVIGDPERMEAILVIDQSDLEFVRVGQRVDMKLDEFPYRTLTAEIEEIAISDLEMAPPELSSKAQGSLTTETDEAGGERPMSVVYQATVPLPSAEMQLVSGFRGRAKIFTRSRTLGQVLWRNLVETFRFG